VNAKPRSRKHLSYVTQTQFIAEPPHDRKQDNVCGEFQVVKRSAGSFIEGAAAVRTEERRVAKFGFLQSFPGSRCSARGAVHQPTLLVQLSF
jgi:hypothetical protein